MRKIMLATTLLMGMLLLCACGNSKQNISDKKNQNPAEATTEYFMLEAYWDEDATEIAEDETGEEEPIPENANPEKDNAYWINFDLDDVKTLNKVMIMTDDQLTIKANASVTKTEDGNYGYETGTTLLEKTYDLPDNTKIYWDTPEEARAVTKKAFQEEFLNNNPYEHVAFNIYIENGCVKTLSAWGY